MENGKIHKAMVALQADLRHAPLNAENPHFRNKYADLQSLLDTVRPALIKHGLSLRQEGDMADGSMVVSTIIAADDGSSVSSAVPLLMKDNTNMQQLGSAITYARRYGLSSLVAIAADEDDDANAAATPTDARASGHKPFETPPPKAGGISDGQRKAIFAIACAIWGRDSAPGELETMMRRKYNKAHSSELTKAEASEMITELKKMNGEEEGGQDARSGGDDIPF